MNRQEVDRLRRFWKPSGGKPDKANHEKILNSAHAIGVHEKYVSQILYDPRHAKHLKDIIRQLQL